MSQSYNFQGYNFSLPFHISDSPCRNTSLIIYSQRGQFTSVKGTEDNNLWQQVLLWLSSIKHQRQSLWIGQYSDKEMVITSCCEKKNSKVSIREGNTSLTCHSNCNNVSYTDICSHVPLLQKCLFLCCTNDRISFSKNYLKSTLEYSVLLFTVVLLKIYSDHLG